MNKILPIILILALFSLTGCKKEKMYKVGQIVCVTNNHPYPKGYPYPVGEIFRITEEKEDGKPFDVYHIKLYSPKLKSHIIVRIKLADIFEFIKIKEEEGE